MRGLPPPSEKTLRFARWWLLGLSIAFWLWHRPWFVQDDVRLYYTAIEGLWGGSLPYRDQAFAYPPYALAWLLLPGLSRGLEGFWIAFAVEVFACDLALKGFLLAAGARLAAGWASLLPCALYSAAGALQHFLFFQRLDVFAAAATTIALVMADRARWLVAGLLIGIAGGTKVFALLMTPTLAFLAWRQERAQRFFTGLYVSFFPLAVVGLWMPWWEFAFAHTGRGLQVESLYASVLWLLAKVGLLSMEWVRVSNFYEVHGPGVSALTVASKVIWIVLVGCSVWRSCLASRVEGASNLGGLVQATWLPVLAFVTFGPVLSTQFMLWLAPLAALVVLKQGTAAGALYMIAAFLTPVVFPSPQYETGLTLAQTTALVCRNLLLVALWVREWGALSAHRHIKQSSPSAGGL